MAQQIINIGSAPNDGTGDALRTAFDKSNDNFAELYDGAGNASAGIWNFNQTDTDTSTAPVSGRFKTNSGNYADATQLAIHGSTVQGISRADTLRKLRAGDIIQCQDTTNSSAWCRYNLQATPVDNGAWFQLNVGLETDGGVASGDNQEIGFIFTANSAGAGGGGNVSSSGTPANGQLAQWTDATHIQGIDASTITAGFAPLASPTFTGDPKAPTPTAGDNDTSIATTAFVTAAVAAASSSGGASPPQGRLTLQSATPVMTTTQAAKTTIYYTPYVGDKIPIYDGSNMVMTAFTELSVATTDTTKNPAAIGASKINDWFVWNDGGTLRLTHGPDWTDDTTRSAGTALVRVQGLWLNNAAITNGPAAQRGTYVGTTRSNASSQLDWIFGTAAVGGGAGFFGVWNAYNRVVRKTTTSDSTASWTYNSTTWRAANANNNNRISFVTGLAEDGFLATHHGAIFSPSVHAMVSVGFDVTNAPSGSVGMGVSTGLGSLTVFGMFSGAPVLGFHFVQAIENLLAAGTVTFNGGGAGGNQFQGLHFDMRM